MLETWLNGTLTQRGKSNTAGLKKKKKEIQSMAASLKLNNQIEGRNSLLGIAQVETTSKEPR